MNPKWKKRRPAKKRGRYARKGLRRGKSISPVHRFKEMTSIATLTAGTAAVGTGTMAFNLAQLGNIPSFRSMFDLYKITGVKLKIIPKFNQADVGSANLLPQLFLATNRDPFTPAPTSIADILNDDSCRCYRLDKPISWYVKAPKPDMSIAFDVAGTQYVGPQNWQLGVSSKYQPWLTTGGNGQSLDQSTLNHYGVRWVLDNSSSAVPIFTDVYVTIYFQCKEQD